ncbi:MAG: glycosyltransferase [Kiritimatiellia bacterium]
MISDHTLPLRGAQRAAHHRRLQSPPPLEPFRLNAERAATPIRLRMKILYLPRMDGYIWASYQEEIIRRTRPPGGGPLAGTQRRTTTPRTTGSASGPSVRGSRTWSSPATPGCTTTRLAREKRLHPALDLSKCRRPKALFLNKEYTQLKPKLEYARRMEFGLLFTHHHETEIYRKATGIPAEFVRFATNPGVYRDQGLPRIYDLCFTGVLINPSFPASQSDARLRVQQKMFHSWRDFRIKKRARYRDLRLFWAANPRSRLLIRINEGLRGPQRVSAEEYARLLAETRITLNGPSPNDMVGLRYYECMASGSLALCSENPSYAVTFPDGAPIVTFRPDLADFDDKLFHYARDEDARRRLADEALAFVRAGHTWVHRVRGMLDALAAHFHLPAAPVGS